MVKKTLTTLVSLLFIAFASLSFISCGDPVEKVKEDISGDPRLCAVDLEGVMVIESAEVVGNDVVFFCTCDTAKVNLNDAIENNAEYQKTFLETYKVDSGNLSVIKQFLEDVKTAKMGIKYQIKDQIGTSVEIKLDNAAISQIK